MKQHLKKCFIPHAENEYKPHFFREVSIGIISVIAVALLVTSMTSSWVVRNTGLGASILNMVLVDLANEERVEKNEAPLVYNTVLESAAKMKADDMATYGYFAHTSPQGLTPWHWISRAGYQFIYAGENLAVDFTESIDVNRAWLNSPTHRANILNEKFTEIGIATREGVLDGQDTIFVVQMFGTPIAMAAPKTEPTPIVPKPAPTLATTQGASVPKPPILAPTVEGASKVAIAPEVETISETDTFVAVKNTEVTEPEVAPQNTTIAPTKYATWYEKLLVFEPNHVSIIYFILIGFIVIALGVMIFVEIHQQHPKNIMYGVGVVGLLIALVIVNYAFFTPVFAAV